MAMVKPAQSARGLFRATGNVASDVVPREAHDFYPTPPEVTRALLAVESAQIRQVADDQKSFGFPATVWEPAAGDGAMVRELRRGGFSVHASDLIDRGCGAEIIDFFDVSVPCAPVLITNPPYKLINARDGKGRWLDHALGLGCPYVALFLNWDWPAAAGLSGLMARHPISRVYLCRWKVDFTGKGAPPQRNAWFIWDADWQGETALRFLDRACDRQEGWPW
jgi:hypothetical protein